ncbi:Legumin A [Morella rubra]|uniref:Legumin A n=1 Tax=Morella rubra TaxID=262757 RepID=A0A6A1UPB3_9ROSI|nr:Legumin A [Morella rubra]
MAPKPVLLSVSLCVLVLFNGCLAQSHPRQRQMGECRLNRLDALEPTIRTEAEAGVIESWEPNDQQFRCAGVAVARRTIEPNGLLLPQYSNAPELVYIVRGRGLSGILLPGCPESYEGSLQQSQGEQSRRLQQQQDRHQKIRYVREGDILALPAGVAHWCYNEGESPLVAISLIDTTNSANQLDQRRPRHFYLAGNPEDEFQQEHQRYGQRRRQQQRQHHLLAGGEHGPRQLGGDNVFGGFDAQFLADVFNVDIETARRLQGVGDNRGNIVMVESRHLETLRPRGWSREEQEREERRERERESERERERRPSPWRRDDNGLDETICSLRLKESMDDPSRADIYNPDLGRISTVNSLTLPVLRWLQLSAERGVLYKDAMYVPHWNLNAHSVCYATKGRAQVQVVDDFGETVFDDEMREGQLLIVPQNFAMVKRASSEGFEWIAFKTTDNAMISPLAGRTSAIRAFPEEVLANAFQISREDARRLKFSRHETALAPSIRSSSESASARIRSVV